MKLAWTGAIRNGTNFNVITKTATRSFGLRLVLALMYLPTQLRKKNQRTFKMTYRYLYQGKHDFVPRVSAYFDSDEAFSLAHLPEEVIWFKRIDETGKAVNKKHISREQLHDAMVEAGVGFSDMTFDNLCTELGL